MLAARALALGLLVGLLAGTDAAALTAEPRILFSSTRPVAEIHVMDADGGGRTQVTRHDPEAFAPAWSPDGSRIAFTGSSGSSVQLWVMDRDGGNPRALGFASPWSEAGAFPDPDWSPGGRRIVLSFVEDIFIVKRNGTDRRRLTRGTAEDWAPAWSPVGGWIAFTRNGQIWRMRVDGSRKQALAAGDEADWSPNGKRIVFTGPGRGFRNDIYTMRADGTDRRRLTRSRRDEWAPAWGPRGRIAFARGFRGPVWVMDADGSDKRRLVRRGSDPSWSPRGGFVAFERSRVVELPNEDPEDVASIFRIRANGAGVATRLLTPELDREVDASPDGSRIAYTSLRPYSRSGVYVADADGASESFLHPGKGPDWSPDGTRILLWHGGALSVVDADGSDSTRLPEPAGHDFEFLSAWRWHPDGARVSFVSPGFECGDVYVMHLDGSDVTRMTRDGCFPDVHTFDWDPSGSTLVFAGLACEDCDAQIFSAAVPDGVPTELTNPAGFVFTSSPRVSPDGAKVAFVRYAFFAETSVWTMNADGTAERRLTRDGAGAGPAWLPVP